MSIDYKPLRSEFGFQSPNFSVTQAGVMTVNSVIANSIASTDEFTLENFIFQNATIDTLDNGTIEFLNQLVMFNNIESVNSTIETAEITNLTVITELVASDLTSSNEINLDANTRVVITNSPLTVHSYSATDRNLIDAEAGDIVFNTNDLSLNYYTGLEWKTTSTGTLSFNNSTITAGTNENITIDPQGTGTVIVDDLQINNLPTNNNQAVRKDYVDSRISAFSIAFGV